MALDKSLLLEKGLLNYQNNLFHIQAQNSLSPRSRDPASLSKTIKDSPSFGNYTSFSNFGKYSKNIIVKENPFDINTPTPLNSGYFTSNQDHHQSPFHASNNANLEPASQSNTALIQSKRSVTENKDETNTITSIDAPTLYKKIRDSLTSSEFEEFAANVAAFNASEQTAEETINNIGKIVKEAHLISQMKTLIYTA